MTFEEAKTMDGCNEGDEDLAMDLEDCDGIMDEEAQEDDTLDHWQDYGVEHGRKIGKTPIKIRFRDKMYDSHCALCSRQDDQMWRISRGRHQHVWFCMECGSALRKNFEGQG